MLYFIFNHSLYLYNYFLKQLLKIVKRIKKLFYKKAIFFVFKNKKLFFIFYFLVVKYVFQSENLF